MKSGIKKILFSAVAAFTVVGMIPMCTYAALSDTDPDEGMTASITDMSRAVTTGEKVSADVTLTGASDINSLDIEVEYDSSAFSYDGISWSGALGEDESLSVHDNGGGVLVLSVDSDTNFTMSGTLATLNFTATANANPALSPSIMILSFTSTDYDGSEDEDEDETEDAAEEDTSTNDSTDNDSSEDAKATDDSGSGSASGSGSSSGSSSGSKSGSSSGGRSVVKAATSSSHRADSSYKTGVFLGNNIFLFVGCGAGLLALIAGRYCSAFSHRDEH